MYEQQFQEIMKDPSNIFELEQASKPMNKTLREDKTPLKQNKERS